MQILHARQPLLFAGLILGAVSASGMAQAGEIQAAPTMSTQSKAGYEKLLNDAELQIKNGNPDAAYAALAPLEFEHAGEERFDYLLGIAALDSGKPDKATFALERVLLVNPDNTAARLDMARAYFQLGDLPRAKTEFSLVLAQHPSDAARGNIEKYLDEISAQAGNGGTHFSGYVEAAAGNDSNVNNSTSLTHIYVDSLAATATLDPTNIKTADNYFGVAVGGEMMHHFNSRWNAFAGADARKRNYTSQASFNALNLDARAGIGYARDNHHVRVAAAGGQFSLDNSLNSTSGGLYAEWREVVNPANQFKLSGQYMQYRFADTVMQQNDYDLQAVGAGWLHAFAGGDTTLSAGLYQGYEKDVSTLITPPASPTGGRTDGARRFSGALIGVQTAAGSRTSVFASAGVQLGTYDKLNYWFQRMRSDRLYTLTLGTNWNMSKHWTLRPQLNYALNVSNIEIYGFNRLDASVSIRRDFR